eukprot:524036-Amorphochlora_amoeboformis.AAC.1
MATRGAGIVVDFAAVGPIPLSPVFAAVDTGSWVCLSEFTIHNSFSTVIGNWNLMPDIKNLMSDIKNLYPSR